MGKKRGSPPNPPKPRPPVKKTGGIGKIAKKQRVTGGNKPKKKRISGAGNKKRTHNKPRIKKSKLRGEKKGLKKIKGRANKMRKQRPTKRSIADRAYERYLKKMFLPEDSVVSRFEMNNVVRERISRTVRFENEMPALWTNILIAAQGVDGSRADDIVVERFIGGPFSARMSLQNNGNKDIYLNRDGVAIFNINGGTLIKNEHTLSVTLPSKEARGGENSVQIGGEWVQSRKQAEELGQWVLTNQGDGGEAYTIHVFGNIFVDLGDIIVIEHGDMNIVDSMRFIITSISNSFDSGLHTEINVRRVWPNAGRSFVHKTGVPQNPILL